MTVGMYEWAVSSSNAGLLIGSDDASNDVVITANFNGTAYLALNDDVNGFTPSITYKKGLYVGIRDGATSLRFYDADGTEYLGADPSTGLNSVDFGALKYAPSSFSSTDVRAGLFFVGSEMVSEVSQLYTAVGDYYSSLNELLKPSNTVAPVISGTAERGETLTTTNGTWDNSPTAYSYQWQRDDINISGATSSTYVLVADDDNTNITCVVSATNNYGTRTATSNTLGPVLGIPTALVDPVASGTPEVDQVLTTTDGTWQGLQPITITYQWRRDTVNISGATSNTYTLVSADLNALVDCQVTATNSIRSTSVDSNDLGPIEAAPVVPSVPVISGVPTITGTAKVGETLTATAASATGEPTPTTSWQWERSDNGTSGWASISGATSSTYTAVSADESKYLRVVQTETNTEGSDSANSAATAQVAAAFDYLLDDYSGAAVAYSLRLLDSTYSGSAVRVRRASDNTEQDIGFVDNELDTSSLETFCSGTDGFVTTWYDQSGSNNTTQTTAANQPKIVSSGSTITENGKPAVQFDGGNDQLTSTFGTTYNQPTYSFLTHNFTSAPSAFDGVIGSIGTEHRLIMGATLKYTLQAGGSLSYNEYSTDQSLLSYKIQSSDPKVFFNGTQESVSAGSSIGTTGLQGLVLGGINSGSGSGNSPVQIQELVIYDSDQDDNRSGIETNINDFYSIYTP